MDQGTPIPIRRALEKHDVVSAYELGWSELKNGDLLEAAENGSANFIQTLLKHDLVDELWLKIFPITLGPGKRLFADGAIPAAFKLSSHSVSPSGVIIANYERAGEVKTGSFA